MFMKTSEIELLKVVDFARRLGLTFSHSALFPRSAHKTITFGVETTEHGADEC